MIRLAIAVLFLAFAGQTGIAKTTNFRISSINLDRQATIHIPDGILASKTQAPVIFLLHGHPGSRASIERKSGFIKDADDRGFIVVIPSGHKQQGETGKFWGIPPFEIDGDAIPIMSDVEFIEVILDKLSSQDIVDPNRIHVVGYSMGGIMAYHLACERSEIFSSAISVGGTMTTPQCNPEHPISILHLHGFEDNSIPYLGGQAAKNITLNPNSTPFDWPDTMSQIRKISRNQSCGGQITSQPDTDTICQSFSCSRNNIIKMCLSLTAGHEWMGSTSRLDEGRLTGGQINLPKMNASDEIWNFITGLPPRTISRAP